MERHAVSWSWWLGFELVNRWEICCLAHLRLTPQKLILQLLSVSLFAPGTSRLVVSFDLLLDLVEFCSHLTVVQSKTTGWRKALRIPQECFARGVITYQRLHCGLSSSSAVAYSRVGMLWCWYSIQQRWPLHSLDLICSFLPLKCECIWWIRKCTSATLLALVRSIARTWSCSFLFKRLYGLGSRRRSGPPLLKNLGSTLFITLLAHTPSVRGSPFRHYCSALKCGGW